MAALLPDRARGLENRRPARHLAFDQLLQSLGSAVLLLRDHAAQVEKALPRVLVIESLVEGAGRLGGGRRPISKIGPVDVWIADAV